MKPEEQQAIALAKYAAIAPLVTDQLEEGQSKMAFYAAVSEKGVRYPDGTLRHPSASTVQSWYCAYGKGGFDALVPKMRSDFGKTRVLDDDAKARITYYRTNFPRMSAAMIYRQLLDDGTFANGECSESTVLRFINQLDSERKVSDVKDMRRYERAHINEVWYGDSCVGPPIKDTDGRKHKVYIIALIDDASRMIVGVNAFYNDNFINLMSVLKSAVSRHGRPKLLSFDNGKPYRNRQMELLSARIAVALNYCEPYTPTSKAKIERWFATLRSQFLASLNMKDIHSLDEFRGSLQAYVLSYNRHPHSSLQGLSPQDRYFREPEYFRRLPQEEIERSFLLEVERRVSADSVIVIDRVEYEVDCRYARQKVRLLYSPDMKEIYLAESDGTLSEIRLLSKQDNAAVKREKIYLSAEEEE